MDTLPFSTGAYNPRTDAATGFCRKKLYNCKSSAVKLQIQQSTTASAFISRREAAVGLGFCFSFLQFLNPQQDSVEANEVTPPPCEFTAASSGHEYCDKVIGTRPEPVKGQLIKVIIKGWDEGILGGDGIPAMSAGGKRKRRIPPAIGYGIRGARALFCQAMSFHKKNF